MRANNIVQVLIQYIDYLQMKSYLNKLWRLFHPFQVVNDSLAMSSQKMINSLNNKIWNVTHDLKTEIITNTRKENLKYTALNSQDHGVTNNTHCGHEVVVSLTTYKERIHEVYLSIESIMQGTVKPNRLILWLAENEFSEDDIPVVLKKQMERGLEIRYCKDIRSYKKIIPTLQLYSEACIVTIDDDVVYEPDLLEHLIASYKKHPDCVSACRIRVLLTDEKGMPLPYMDWKWGTYIKEPSHHNFLTGVGGTLFPPHLLHEQVMNEDVFITIAPSADDVWLNAMLMLNGVKVVKAFTHNPNGNDFLINESPYVKPLWYANTGDNGANDKQIHAVWDKYKLYEIIKNESISI